MTKEEILLMKPGIELNAKIAEEIMGKVVVQDKMLGPMERLLHDGESVWGPPQPYSEDLIAAEQVVDKMLDLGYEDAVHWSRFGDGRYTEAEAICKAALLAILGGKVECPENGPKRLS
jgi:hypothetical protein